MSHDRHILTLQFLVDLRDAPDRHRSGRPASSRVAPGDRDAPDNGGGHEAGQQALIRALLSDPVAQWAFLAQALGPLVAAEAREALPAALDTTLQRSAAALAHVGVPDEIVCAFEDAVAEGELDQSLPIIGRAIRVLLINAALLRVVNEPAA